MNDQAASLRVIRGCSCAKTLPRAPIQRERAIAITGGKGGVGKSSITANLAVAYAATGAKTLVVDADLGMADLNLLLGVAPDLSLLDALQGTPIADVLVQAHGITLLPALNGSSGLANLGPAARARALALIESLATKFDTLILDIAAGIGAVQTSFAGAASDTIVVVTPEPLSMADAYACLKVLRTEHGVERAYLLPNRVTSSAQADQITSSLSALVDRFLDLEVIALPAIRGWSNRAATVFPSCSLVPMHRRRARSAKWRAPWTPWSLPIANNRRVVASGTACSKLARAPVQLSTVLRRWQLI